MLIISAFLLLTLTAFAGCAAEASPHPPVKPVKTITAHPFVATTDSVTKLRAPLFPIFVLSLVAAAVFLGLEFTTEFSWLGKIGIPVSVAVCGASLLGIIALPFLPWVLLAGVIAAVLFVAYELIRAKGKLKTAVSDAEEDLGLSSSVSSGGTSTTPAAGTTPAASPAGKLGILASAGHTA